MPAEQRVGDIERNRVNTGAQKIQLDYRDVGGVKNKANGERDQRIELKSLLSQ